MSSWWRQYAEKLGAVATGKSWRKVAIDETGLTREDLAPFKGGWDRRIASYFEAIEGVGPWARHLVEGDGSQITNGVVHEGDPVFHEGVRVVHNG